jgi:nicotinate-nucleotide adenylyltransferase
MASPDRARRVGLLGGSFDPVHNAHLVLAHGALDALMLDEVRWIPARAPWQKTRALAPAEQRAEMVRLAIAGISNFRFEPCELERSGTSYTIDTVLELRQREPAPTQWFLLLGQDQLARLHTWHRWRELVALASLAVANRAGDAPRMPPELEGAGFSVTEVPLPPMAISSTEIRARVASGLDIAALVPAPVARYIAERGLYRHPLRS